jgi:hypothetical protein
MIAFPDFNQAKEIIILGKKKVPVVKAKVPVKMTSEEIRKFIVPNQKMYWGWQKDERDTAETREKAKSEARIKTPKS